ncbi:MAG: alpha/beta fold hydrolase [Proteobacteria bacterium]|nr:alpha/beta fold hydrolase [Pseudomonadota bacterium]
MAEAKKPGDGYHREDSDFTSRGVRCAGWLYLPEGRVRPPLIIMGHGFAAERTFRLPAYAERFAARGLAVLVFDYRNFGDSDGKPRNLVDHRRHIEDWTAAIAHARSLDRIDPDRIALWGSSFGGGHVIVSAARDGRIAAVVSQVPFVDGRATLGSVGLKFTLLATLAALRDYIGQMTGRPPYTIPVVGEPGRIAAMNREDAMSGYLALVPEGSTWKNRVPARALLTASMYRPVTEAARINCPVLFVVAEKDNYIPAEAVERTAARVPRAEMLRLDVGHFDVYVGDCFKQVVEAEADFLQRCLTAGR